MSPRKILALSVACFLGGLPAQIAAQDVPPPLVGERVRARTLDGATHDGLVRTLDATELGLQIDQDGADLLLLPLSALEKLEVQRGQGRAGEKGARIGAVVGGSLGAILAVSFISGDCPITGSYGTGCPDAALLLVPVLAVVVAAPFALIGALVGSAFKTDRWEEVPLSPQLRTSVTPIGRLQISLSIPVGAGR